jgi:hypothetical protein
MRMYGAGKYLVAFRFAGATMSLHMAEEDRLVAVTPLPAKPPLVHTISKAGASSKAVNNSSTVYVSLPPTSKLPGHGHELGICEVLRAPASSLISYFVDY